MSEDIFKRIGSRMPYGTSEPSVGGDAFDWFGGFVKSSFESIPELVGVTPSTETLQWRQTNPGAAFLSEVAGMTVPYMGWFSATKKIKTVDNFLNGLGDVNKAPFLAGAMREAVRFAPFEAGRVLASQLVGDQDIGTMAGEAAVNLALGAGVGGLVQSFASAGTRQIPLANLAPGIDLAAPLQFQQRFIKDILAQGNVLPENAERLNYALLRMRDAAKAEFLPEGTRYVNRIEGEEGTFLSDTLNRLFKWNDGKGGFQRKRFVSGSGDFQTPEAAVSFATQAGLPPEFEDFGQYFRAINFEGKRAGQTAGLIHNALTKHMETIGNGWYMGKEADDGLFVMARKVTGDEAKPDALDSWVVFKTDQPGKFVPARQQWANTVVAQSSWNPVSTLAADGGAVYNSLTGFMRHFPFMNYRVLGGNPTGIAGAIDRLMPKNFKRGGNELVERMKDATKEYLAPARLQFVKSPRANWIHSAARVAYEAAANEAQRLVYGEIKLDAGKSIFHAAMRGQAQSGEANQAAIKTLIDSLSDDEIGELWKVWRQGAAGDALDALKASGQISERVYGAAQRLERIDGEIWANLNKVQKATGNPQTKKRGGHYGLSHRWLGDTRIALRGQDGKVVAIASGFNRRGAQAKAKELQETLAREGTPATVAEEFQISQIAEIPKDLKPVIHNPSFILERQGLRGFQWDNEAFTRQELLEAFDKGVQSRMKYQANLAVNDVFLQELAKLAIEDPHAYRLLTARLNDLAGVQGPLGLVTNKIADQVLAPMLGSNSATKIAQVANTTMWHLQLGAGKLSYPIVNALTFLQTVMPEISYITSAAPERLAGDYTYFATAGARGVVGSVGTLNPLKFMWKSVGAMRKPSPELREAFERATNERVIDPRLVEEYIGESASKVSDWRTALSSPGGFAGWLKAASEWLPAQSERMSRAHAFTVGHLLAKDYLGITQPDHLYRFARQFTENTMFLYSAADRPRIFTTPAGSLFGLFKNWMANYTGTMLNYMGEGFTRNNWAPLLWQTAGTFGVGGVAGTPLYLAANGLANAFADKSLLELTYDAFGEDNQGIADTMMYGLPAGLTGISLYSQTASPLANPVRDASMLFSTAHLDRLQYFGKALGAGWDHWQATGEHPGRSPQFLSQLSRALAPVTMYRVMGAAQEGAINSTSSGYPIMQDVGLYDRLFYMAGFNSVEMDKGYAIADQLFREKESRQAHVGRLGQAFAEAQLNKDSAMMQGILRQAYAAGLDPSSVLRSAQARVSKMTTPMLERNFKPQDLARFEQVLGGQ